MEKITANHPLSMSENIVQTNIETLKKLFPTIVKEGKIDIKELEALLGNEVETNEEYYRFTWAGKSNARREANKPSTATLRPDKASSKDWDTTQNIFIEGDNLEVLKLLQKSYANQIKMIYIDPPYNTGKDFVYKDNYNDNLRNYLQITGQADADGKRISTNTESDGRYHSNWLNMMYPRLKLARNLLKDDGVIFISIDDNEANNLKKLCEEIFGEENFIVEFPRITKKAGKTTDSVAKNNDYVLCFSKSSNSKFNTFLHTDEGYRNSDEYEEERGKYKLNQTLDYGSIQYSPSLDYEITIDNEILRPGNVSFEQMEERKRRNPKSDFCWRWSKDLFNFGLKNGFIVVKESSNGKRIYTKTYQNAIIEKNGNQYFVQLIERTKSATTLDFIDNEYSNDNSKKDLARVFDTNVFDYSKPVSLIKQLCFLASNPNSIILDFFAGSGTTAHAVMQLNADDGGDRKFICVQLPEPTDESSEAFKAGYKTIAEITKERIRRAGDKIKAEQKEDLFTQQGKTLDIGFKAFKLDSSNIRTWDGNPNTLEDNLFSAVNNLKEDRTEQDILFEVLLKYGLNLTVPIEEKTVNNQTIYSVANGVLLVCLGSNITTQIAEAIGAWKETLSPITCRVLFKDNGFANDVEKTNSIQILKRFGITEINSI